MKDDGDALHLVQVARQMVRSVLAELTDLTAGALARQASLLEEIGAEIHASIEGEICYPDAMAVRSEGHLRQIEEALGKLRHVEAQVACDLWHEIEPPRLALPDDVLARDGILGT